MAAANGRLNGTYQLVSAKIWGRSGWMTLGGLVLSVSQTEVPDRRARRVCRCYTDERLC